MMGRKLNRDALNHLIEHIPKHSRGAEIGVWHGFTSLEIMRHRKLKELHLVDPWSIKPYQKGSEHGTFKQYLARYKGVVKSDHPHDFQAHYDRIYDEVVDRFKPYKQVKIHRMTSRVWFDAFKGKLDWVYLDADHSFDGCFADLCSSRRVVRKGGLIFGDDYRWPGAVTGKPGVNKAVDYFRKIWGFDLQRIGENQYKFTVE